MMVEMANWHAKEGNEVTVLTWDDRKRADHFEPDRLVNRIRLVFPPASSKLSVVFQSLKRIYRFRFYCQRTKPDVVISFVDVTNMLASISLIGTGINLIVSERTDPESNNIISPFWKLLRRLLYKLPFKIVAQTERAAKFLEVECGRHVDVIGNPIQLVETKDVPEEEFILNVGRMDFNKGQEILIRAFSLVLANNPTLNLIILGDGSIRGHLLSLIEELGLNDKVILPGKVNNVEDWMRKALCVAQSSRIEGFPNVLLEAMALGRPVISTDCPSGPAELIKDGINGILVPVDDVHALANAINTILSDNVYRQKLGSEARKVGDIYNINTIMLKWNNLIMS